MDSLLGHSRLASGQISIFVESSEIKRQNEGIFSYLTSFYKI